MNHTHADRRLAELRRRAEERTGEPAPPRDMEEALAIAQELAVHQVELQLQNQELLAAQAAQAEAHELYHKLFDLAPVGYLRLDRGGRVIEANQAAAELTARGQEDLKGMALISLVKPEHLERLQRHFARADRAADAAGCEVALEGGRRVSLHSVALDRVDHERGYLCALVDISEQHRQRKELAASRESYRRLYQDLPIPSLTWELRGNELYMAEVNRAELELTRGEIRRFIGRPITDLYGHRPDLLRDARRAFGTGEVVSREHALTMLTTGEDKFVRHTWARVSGDRLLGHIEDISDTKRLADALEQHSRNLEELVRERTAALEARSTQLHEANITLKVLLENRQREKADLEDSIMSGVKLLVEPIIERLMVEDSREKRKAMLAAMGENLRQITSGFSSKLVSAQYGLSSRELEVAALIKDGKTTDEIADLLNIAPGSVSFHRDNIRNKLGLKGKKVRLATHLRQME